MLSLEPVMTYTVRTTGPLADTVGAPDGTVQYWQVAEARLSGPGIEASLAMPGSDWMKVGGDGFWRPDVRAAFETSDGAVILLHYTGLVEQTEAFKQAAAENRETRFEDQSMRMALRFETGDPRYRWLTQSLFVAEGRLLGTGHIEYRVYRVQ